jgi:hypothetical protein
MIVINSSVCPQQAYPDLSNVVGKARSVPLSGAPGACIIKLVTAVIYGFCNNLERVSPNTRLGWKGFPETNTLAYYGNRKLPP